MDISPVDKNRMTVAMVATAIFLAVAFMASGNSGNETVTTVADVTSTTYDLGLDSNVDAPANLDGPVSADPNGQGQIAYPADNSGRMVRGNATYKRLPDSVKNGCSTTLVPLGATITVLNLNNGRKATCININIGPMSGSFDITLNTAVFEAIAELVDAPLPVELTW
ncbi:MAG: hypothetical protein WCP50_06825 [Actinomycetota bacterium]